MPLRQGWTFSWACQFYGGESSHISWEKDTSYRWEMPWSQVFPSLCCVLSSEGTAGCLAANLSGRVWTHSVLSPLSKVHCQIRDPSFECCPWIQPQHPGWFAPQLSPITMSFIVGSPHVLPSSWESLFLSSFLCRILHLVLPVSDPLPQHPAHSSAAVEHTQCNPPRQKGHSVAGMLFWCCLSVYRLLLSCPEGKHWSLEASEVHIFMRGGGQNFLVCNRENKSLGQCWKSNLLAAEASLAPEGTACVLFH